MVLGAMLHQTRVLSGLFFIIPSLAKRCAPFVTTKPSIPWSKLLEERVLMRFLSLKRLL